MIWCRSSSFISSSLTLLEELRCLGDRLRVLRIRPAAAQVARECFPYFVFGGVRVSVKQRFSGHDKAGRAVTALHTVMLDVGFNEGMFCSRDAFGSFNGCAIALDGQRHTGENGPAVHDHGARAARAPITKHLDPGQPQPVVDQRVESNIRLDVEFVMLTIDLELDQSFGPRQRLCAMFGDYVGFERIDSVEARMTIRTDGRHTSSLPLIPICLQVYTFVVAASLSSTYF